MAAPALAGPYVNVEANSGFTDQTTLERPQTPMWGYAGTTGAIDWYAQVGGSYVSPDGGDAETVPLVRQVYPSPLRTL